MNAEKMRSSVLAYCEEVCKGVEPCRPVDVRGPIHVADYLNRFVIREWLSKDGKRYANAHLSDVFKDGDFDPTIAYALLGLEARDAVEAKNAELAEKVAILENEVDFLKTIRESQASMIGKLHPKTLDLQARNTALVAAINQAVFDLTDEDADPEEDAFDFGQRIAEGLEVAIAANTEKGGAND